MICGSVEGVMWCVRVFTFAITYIQCNMIIFAAAGSHRIASRTHSPDNHQAIVCLLHDILLMIMMMTNFYCVGERLKSCFYFGEPSTGSSLSFSG